MQDPTYSQTFNRYAYCGNNPVNHIDPTGHSFWKSVKKFFQKFGDFISPLGRAIVTGDWKNFGFQVLNIATAVFAPNPFIFAAGFLSYTSRATANIGDNASFEISKVLGYAGIAAGVIGIGVEIKNALSSASSTSSTTASGQATAQATLGNTEEIANDIFQKIGSGNTSLGELQMALNETRDLNTKIAMIKAMAYTIEDEISFGVTNGAAQSFSIMDNPIMLFAGGIQGKAMSGMPKVANLITGYTQHGLMQAIGREGNGVAIHAIYDAVKNPIKIIEQNNETIKYIGEKATVILNKAGKIVTTWGERRVK